MKKVITLAMSLAILSPSFAQNCPHAPSVKETKSNIASIKQMGLDNGVIIKRVGFGLSVYSAFGGFILLPTLNIMEQDLQAHKFTYEKLKTKMNGLEKYSRINTFEEMKRLHGRDYLSSVQWERIERMKIELQYSQTQIQKRMRELYKKAKEGALAGTQKITPINSDGLKRLLIENGYFEYRDKTLPRIQKQLTELVDNAVENNFIRDPALYTQIEQDLIKKQISYIETRTNTTFARVKYLKRIRRSKLLWRVSVPHAVLGVVGMAMLIGSDVAATVSAKQAFDFDLESFKNSPEPMQAMLDKNFKNNRYLDAVISRDSCFRSKMKKVKDGMQFVDDLNNAAFIEGYLK